MAKRKQIPKKLRFEVFKRDSFRCQYCGVSAPDVLLQVDHIKPVKEGGTSDITNLITSCVDCNLGKGARKLDDKSVVARQHKQLEELNERREQLKMMMEWREELLKLEEEKLNYAVSKFEEIAKCKLTEVGVNELRRLLSKNSFDILLEAIDISTRQYLIPKGDDYDEKSKAKAFNYIGRICTCKRKEKEKPYLKQLYYIRAILRNRLHYYNEELALNYLEKAYLKGYTIEQLKELAKNARNWSSFTDSIRQMIEGQE